MNSPCKARLHALADAVPDQRALHAAEAPDRIAWHLSRQIERALSDVGESDRARVGVEVARALLNRLGQMVEVDPSDAPSDPATVLHAILGRRPDGSTESIAQPLIPLLDTTLLTNAPGEPNLRSQLRSEIESADRVTKRSTCSATPSDGAARRRWLSTSKSTNPTTAPTSTSGCEVGPAGTSDPARTVAAMGTEDFDPDLLAKIQAVIAPGETVHTLGQHRPNLIGRIDHHGIEVTTQHSTDAVGGSRLVPAWMFNEVWRRLQTQPEVERDHVDRLAVGRKVKRSSIVFAVLARLDEVTVVRDRPLALAL